MEGRDIGSVVFPDAPVKIYLSPTRRRAAGASPGAGGRATWPARSTARDRRDAGTNPHVPAEARS